MTTRLRHARIALAAITAFAGGNAFAALLTYSGEDSAPARTVPPGGNAATARDAFQAQLVNSSIRSEGFESFTTGNQGPLSLPFGGAPIATLTSAATTGHVENNNGDVGSGFTGRFNTTAGGSLWWESAGSFGVQFDQGVSALGFYGTDWSDFSGSLSLALFDTNGNPIYAGDPALVLSGPGAGNVSGSLSFFGLTVSDARVGRVQFTVAQNPNNTTLDVLGFDDLLIGDLKAPPSDVPEPATLALAALGLAGLAASRQRRSVLATPRL